MDCLDGMKKIDSECIDAIISDPPYQLSSMAHSRPDQSEEGSYGKEVPFSRVQAKKGFMNKSWDILPSVEILKECYRVLKNGAFSLWLMTPRMDSQTEFVIRLKQAGFNIAFTPLYWAYASGFPKAFNISKSINKKAKIEEAKALEGSYAGFQPKPAVEVIIVAMKPIKEKTYIDQALLHLKEPEHNQLGGTWFDDVRIPTTQADKSQDRTMIQKADGYEKGWGMKPQGKVQVVNMYKGRFPANLLVSDNILDRGIKSKSGGVGGRANHDRGEGYGFKPFKPTYEVQEDEGDFSRYFSLDEWYRVNIEDLPKEQQKTMPFLYVPKASKSERNKGLENMPDRYDVGVYGDGIGNVPKEEGQRPNPYKNIHPTAKPIKLMSYLITLTTRENDIVLDPFTGSGTTAISSILLKRRFIGFEREAEYHKIATERIKYYQNKEVL